MSERARRQGVVGPLLLEKAGWAEPLDGLDGFRRKKCLCELLTSANAIAVLTEPFSSRLACLIFASGPCLQQAHLFSIAAWYHS